MLHLAHLKAGITLQNFHHFYFLLVLTGRGGNILCCAWLLMNMSIFSYFKLKYPDRFLSQGLGREF